MAEMEQLAGHSQGMVEDFEQRLEHTLHVFKQKAAKQVAEEFPKLAERLVEHSAKQLHDQVDEATRKFKEQMETSGTLATEGAGKRLAEMERATLEGLTTSARSMVENTLGPAARALEEQLRSAAEASRREVTSALEERSQATREKLERDFIARHQERLGELTAAGMKTLETQAQVRLAEFEERLEGTLSTFRQKATKRVADELPKIATELLERGSQQLQKQLDETLARLKGDCKASGEAIVEDARQHLLEARRDSAESFRKEAKSAAEKTLTQASDAAEQRLEGIFRRADGAVTKIETAQQKMEAGLEARAADFDKRLAQASASGLENVGRGLKAHIDTFEKKLEEALQGYRQKAVEQAAREFPTVAGEVIDRATNELHRQSAAAAERIKADLQNAGAQLVEEARQQVANQVQVSLHPVTESVVEQCRGQLRNLAKDFASGSQKHLEEELQQVVRKQRRTAQDQVEEMARVHLERTRQAFARIEPLARPKPTGKMVFVLGALAPTLLFLYLASRPIMRLKADPPVDFLDAYPDWTASHHDVADRLGRAYWDWAALHLTHDYPYGSKLPDQPPVEFDVEGNGFPTGIEEDLARQKYWEKLRDLWTQPQSWDKVSPWSP